MVICLEQGADLHMAQLMPLPLTVSCFRKIQIGFTFRVPAHPGSPGQKAVKRVHVNVCCGVTVRSLDLRLKSSPVRSRVVLNKGPLNWCCCCLRYGDSVDNTAEENSSVFSLIRMHSLPSAMACGQ